MHLPPQSISVCIGIPWLFIVNVQAITKSFPSIKPSNTSTMWTECPEIPNHFKAFHTNLFLSRKEPSFFDWSNHFLIPWNMPQLLLSLLPLQLPWRSESFSLPYNLPPCGEIHHRTDTTHVQTFLACLPRRFCCCLCWDPSVQVEYIQQLLQQEPSQVP